uniref:Uncharacterized protein n=1 Tax=Ditylenchus dipsaci TaxID=166011 RepID=A0A915E671_9BILA
MNQPQPFAPQLLVDPKQPNAEIFFLHLTPSGRKENERRKFVSEVNAKMEEKLKDKASVIYVDTSLIESKNEQPANPDFLNSLSYINLL